MKERTEDIIPIARHLLWQASPGAATDEIRLSPEAITALLTHSRQKKVRELSNLLDRALSTINGDVIELADLSLPLKKQPSTYEMLGFSSSRDVQAEAEKSAP